MMRLLVLFLVVSLLWVPVSVQALSISPDAVNGASASVSCGTSATLLLAANSKRRSFLVVAPAANTVTVYVGFSSAVTTSGSTSGIPLDAKNNLSDSTYVGALYCIVASGAAPLIAAETKR